MPCEGLLNPVTAQEADLSPSLDAMQCRMKPSRLGPARDERNAPFISLVEILLVQDATVAFDF
jgi:hypothetical protein